jgi:hypothetical protein
MIDIGSIQYQRELLKVEPRCTSGSACHRQHDCERGALAYRAVIEMRPS